MLIAPYSMKFQKQLFNKLIVILFAPVMLSQCATEEVRKDFSKRVERNGNSYVDELAAQSPFKKVELSWREANELMRDRNPKYHQALLSKKESGIKKGAVKNFTYEVRKSITDSVQTTLHLNEIAKAMNNPVSSMPKQLRSITDLKNISHSLTQSEWERVLLSIKADIAEREEMVMLHVLFCQSENLVRAEKQLEKIAKVDEPKQNKAFVTELEKARGLVKKERGQWLDRVRDFYNAEFYDVEFKDYKAKLDFYRHVSNPVFSDWKRWRLLENSEMLASEMQKEHREAKPLLPGMNVLKRKLGVMELQSQLGHQRVMNEKMATEVRQMLRNWRELKSVQKKIVASDISYSKSDVMQALGVKDVKRVISEFKLKKTEIDKLRVFWAMDEDCWES